MAHSLISAGLPGRVVERSETHDVKIRTTAAGQPKVGVALSIQGHFRPCATTSITYGATTILKLGGGDFVPQHDGEFDE